MAEGLFAKETVKDLWAEWTEITRHFDGSRDFPEVQAWLWAQRLEVLEKRLSEAPCQDPADANLKLLWLSVLCKRDNNPVDRSMAEQTIKCLLKDLHILTGNSRAAAVIPFGPSR